MYIETMQEILTRSPTLVVDDKLKGLVPFLPLSLPAQGAPTPGAPRAATPGPPSAGASPGQPGASR